MDVKPLTTIVVHVPSSSALNIRAATEEECEVKLAKLIREMNQEIAARNAKAAEKHRAPAKQKRQSPDFFCL